MKIRSDFLVVENVINLFVDFCLNKQHVDGAVVPQMNLLSDH